MASIVEFAQTIKIYRPVLVKLMGAFPYDKIYRAEKRGEAIKLKDAKERWARELYAHVQNWGGRESRDARHPSMVYMALILQRLLKERFDKQVDAKGEFLAYDAKLQEVWVALENYLSSQGIRALPY